MAAVVADLRRAKATVELVFGILKNFDACRPQALDLPVHIGNEYAHDGRPGHLNRGSRVGLRWQDVIGLVDFEQEPASLQHSPAAGDKALAAEQPETQLVLVPLDALVEIRRPNGG